MSRAARRPFWPTAAVREVIRLITRALAVTVIAECASRESYLSLFSRKENTKNKLPRLMPPYAYVLA